MQISRREFLGSAAAAAVLPRLALVVPARCTVLDLGESCALRESLSGYRLALANARPRKPVLVIPAALEIPSALICRCLCAGGTVILEAGDLPLTIWPRRAPYVDFTWPVTIKVRDFSKVKPLHENHGEVIATADGIPVASKCEIGLGTLIFLGTPLGPALWADDHEAKQWLSAVLSGAAYSRGCP